MIEFNFYSKLFDSVPVGIILEKAVCRSFIFDNMALYFECRINEKRTPLDCFLAILPTVKSRKKKKRD